MTLIQLVDSKRVASLSLIRKLARVKVSSPGDLLFGWHCRWYNGKGFGGVPVCEKMKQVVGWHSHC